jgi:transposase-like protein
MTCHNCRIETVKAGRSKNGMQRHKCQQCGKRFTEGEKHIFGSDSCLPEEKSLMILRCLLEGNSVRSTARLCEVEPKTVLKLLVLAGDRCERLLGDRLRNVQVTDVQADEIWSFPSVPT